MLPEVVFLPHAENVIHGHTDLLMPDTFCLIIILIHRSQSIALRFHFQHFGAIFPGPVNGLCLEIISEGEITQHFEKGAMTRRLSHIFRYRRVRLLRFLLSRS